MRSIYMCSLKNNKEITTDLFKEKEMLNFLDDWSKKEIIFLKELDELFKNKQYADYKSERGRK